MGASRPGYILILVLWSLALIGAVAAVFASATRTSISQALAEVERAQAHYAARGACIQTAKDLSIGVRRAQVGAGVDRVARREQNIRVDNESGGVQIGNLPVFPAEMAAAGGFLGEIARKLEGVQGAQPDAHTRDRPGGASGSGRGGSASAQGSTGEGGPVEAGPAALIATGYGEMVIQGVRVEVWLESESGKLNINNAPRAMLESLLTQYTGDAARARSLVDDIESYRISMMTDSDPARRGRRERLSHEALQGRPFGSIEELSNIPSLDSALRDRLLGSLSVYSSGAVDPNYAPIEVLRALGFLDERTLRVIAESREARVQITPETMRAAMGTGPYSRVAAWMSFSEPPAYTARTRATVGQTTARYLIRLGPAQGEAGQAGVVRLLESREDWI